MLRFDTVLFDLDGTLTDPAEGITNSVAYALERFGFHVEDRSTLLPFIGPPLKESFVKFYGLSDADGERAVDIYREYFKPTGIFENRVYPGVPEMLETLRAAGLRLCIASSKPEVFVQKILDHFDLAKYFDAVCGSELDGRRTDKAEVIAETLRRCPAERPVMVGDRHHDVDGAKKNGLPCAGVLFGYGGQEELAKAGADFIAADILQLTEWLLAEI